MTTPPLPPFSTRNRREKKWIEEDFPIDARTGLLHILAEAINRNYLQDWFIVAQELRRIMRIPPANYTYINRNYMQHIKEAQSDAVMNLYGLDWAQSYDFCERLFSHLARDICREYNDETLTTTKVEAQAFFAKEVQRVFDEESLGYEFRDGLVQRRGKRHTMAQINEAEKALADQRLEAARRHFSKARRYFHDRKKVDHENTVKEAVCAVEAAAKELFPDAKANTLGDFVGWATSNKRNLLPKTIGQTFSGLYAFRSSGEGVAHGAASGGAVTAEISEYVLGLAASQIILLAGLARKEGGPPF